MTNKVWIPSPMFNALTKRIRSKLSVPPNWSASLFQFGRKYTMGINLSCQDTNDRTACSWSIDVVVPDETASAGRKMLTFMDLEEQSMRHLTDEEIVAKLQPYINSKVNASRP